MQLWRPLGLAAVNRTSGHGLCVRAISVTTVLAGGERTLQMPCHRLHSWSHSLETAQKTEDGKSFRNAVLGAAWSSVVALVISFPVKLVGAFGLVSG